MTDRLKSQLDFLAAVDKMKSVYRQTMLIDLSRREDDAEHSWHIALMALTLREYAADDAVDFDRVVRMALVHDLVEVYAGDTFAYDERGYSDKEAREAAAADRLFGSLPEPQGEEFRALWEEFDEMLTPDAMYANACDRLQPFLNNSRTDGATWTEHGVSRGLVLKRMAPIRSAMPALWEFVEATVAAAVENGWLK